jgi:YbbR domain-containing protein
MRIIAKAIRNFFNKIWVFIDKRILIPITKMILSITSRFDKSGKMFENWLSKSNTLLFVSLFVAVTIFIVVDQKILIFSESSAEVLKKQPVNVIYNEEAYVIEGLPTSVDITLIGSKADLYFAKQSPSHDINVDLSDLKPGTHKVNIKYNQALPSIDYKVNPSEATVIIYPKISATKTLTVDLLNQDSLSSKLVIKSVNIANDKVVIKGADHQLQKVATVKALIDIKNLVKQEVGVITLKDVPLKAYDEKGNVVDVEIVPKRINAEIEIASPSKELPIKVIPKGDLAFGWAISSIDINETKVLVYGNEDDLANLKFIPVEIDVNGLKENRQYKMELSKPVGIKSMSINNVTVNVSLEKSIDMEINDISIEYRNLNDIYTVQGLSQVDTKVSVVLKGVESVLQQIKAEDITAYLDLKGYGEGEHEVEVYVEGSDVKVQYLAKTKKVRIRIVKKQT